MDKVEESIFQFNPHNFWYLRSTIQLDQNNDF